ncbi:MAG: hypothetical protein ABI433_04355 [Burkholderiaceae bacterium]
MQIPMFIESGLEAHFKQDDGPSLPGVSWLVRIEHAGHVHHARVKALLAPDTTKATRKDGAYQARTTMQYLAAEIENGWNPALEREHTIHIGNPHGQPAQPWWKFW